MGKTNIQYADEVSNPLFVVDLETGKRGTHCEKPDPEGTCRGCWAEVLNTKGSPKNKRFGTGLTYDRSNRDRVKWKTRYKEMGRLSNLDRRKPMSGKFPGHKLVVFTNDTYDLFQPSISDELRDWVFDCYDHYENLNLLIQSTYVSLMNKYLTARYPDGLPRQYIIGMSAGTQKFLDDNYKYLRSIKARRRYVIFEPLLEAVDMSDIFGLLHFDYGKWILGAGQPFVGSPAWIIVGFESGSNARPGDSDWARILRDQTKAAGAAFLWKQWGEWVDAANENFGRVSGKRIAYMNERGAVTDVAPQGEDDGWHTIVRIGKKKAGRILDGRTWDEFPEVKE